MFPYGPSCPSLYLCFAQFNATHPLHAEEQLILAKDLGVQSHSNRLAIFCTTNSSPVLAKRGRKILKIRGKNTILINILYTIKLIF